MTLELKILLALSLLCLALALIQSAAYGQQIGNAGMLGDRSQVPQPKGFAGRALRAHANLVENLLPFAAVALVARAMDISDQLTMVTAAGFLIARIVHACAYLAGVPVLRSLAWVAGGAVTVTYATHLVAIAQA